MTDIVRRLKRSRPERRTAGGVLRIVFVPTIAGLLFVLALSFAAHWQDQASPAPLAANESRDDRVAGVSFTLCSRHPFQNCVVDGDTFYLGSQPIRIEDIDAPETHPSRCGYEAALGAKATRRLNEILNAGTFQLQRGGNRDRDQYGRELRTPVCDGHSLGGILVSEGLARRWTGRRLPWCDDLSG